MDAKSYLEHISYIPFTIQSHNDVIAEYQGYKNFLGLEQWPEIDAAMKEKRQQIKQLQAELAAFDKLAGRLPDLERDVVIMHFRQRMTFDAIAEQLNYSIDNLFHIRKKYIKHVDTLLKAGEITDEEAAELLLPVKVCQICGKEYHGNKNSKYCTACKDLNTRRQNAKRKVKIYLDPANR